MKHIVLTAALALTAVLAISSVAPVQAQPFWYSGSGPTKGGM
ncbi:MAG TPA: hypothetical protein VNM46_02420 [Xanthobacteraceae bacterium]|nr:hypothetical protein [Xanthobacteraceae bacterium]